MVARDFDQYLFFYEFLNAFTESLEKKLTGKGLNTNEKWRVLGSFGQWPDDSHAQLPGLTHAHT